jgi:hypothetical protein
MRTGDVGMYSFFWSSADAEKPTARSSAPRKMIANTHIPLLKNDK